MFSATTPLTRWILGTRYPRGGQMLPILMYHQVLKERDVLRPGVPDLATVAVQLRTLADHFTVLPVEDAVPLLREGRLPRSAVCITFDDGYRDNHDNAWPLLKHLKLPATVYVATGFLDGGIMFNDLVVEAVRRMPAGRHDFTTHGLEVFEISDMRSRLSLIGRLCLTLKYLTPENRCGLADDLRHRAQSALPTDLMMDREQVRRMARGGIRIGGHTLRHPILATTDLASARHEIIANRDEILAITDLKPRSFAYPNGKPNLDYTRDHARLVEEAGYEVAVATSVGVATAASCRFQLPRFVLNETHRLKVLARMWRMHSYPMSDCAA